MFLRQLTALSSRRARLLLFSSAKPVLATRLPLATSIRFNSTTVPQPQQPPKKQEPEITKVEPPKKLEVEIKETVAKPPPPPPQREPEVEIKESAPAKKPEAETKDNVSPPKEPEPEITKVDSPKKIEVEIKETVAKPPPQKEPETEIKESAPTKKPEAETKDNVSPQREPETEVKESAPTKKPESETKDTVSPPKQPKVETPTPTQNTAAPTKKSPANIEDNVDSHLLAPTEKVSESNMHPKLINAFIHRIGSTFTPVQKRCMNEFNESETGIIVRAKTGTGKTFAFGLPVMNDHLNALDSNRNLAKSSVNTVIFCPTRDLCTQNQDALQNLWQKASEEDKERQHKRMKRNKPRYDYKNLSRDVVTIMGQTSIRRSLSPFH
ncbi:unnamed protein product [Ambrosiozyma monospora]|uniref:ATP-dependent RNA helicase n=1 Tax=Ambrosiozyma monospora TaxID=43982 RepID=A0A9W6Z6Y4_AMBMO|nr:unnamed protein product [Ambrosiozyma monospora]